MPNQPYSRVNPDEQSQRLALQNKRLKRELAKTRTTRRVMTVLATVFFLLSVIFAVGWAKSCRKEPDPVSPTGTSEKTSGRTDPESTVGQEEPVITLSDFQVEFGKAVAWRQMLSVFDAQDGEYDIYDTAHVRFDGTAVDTGKIDDYPVTVTATDNDGNTAEKTVTVSVVHQNIGEDEVRDYVRNLMATLVNDGMSREKKLKAIYDYIKYKSGVKYVSYSDKNNPCYREGYYGFTLKSGDCYTTCCMAQLMVESIGLTENKDYYVVRRAGERQSDHYWLLIDFGEGQFYHFDPGYHILDWDRELFKLTDAEVEEFTVWYNRDCPGWNYYRFDHSLYPATPA